MVSFHSKCDAYLTKQSSPPAHSPRRPGGCLAAGPGRKSRPKGWPGLRSPPSLQDPVHLLLLHPLRRKCAAGVAAIRTSLNSIDTIKSTSSGKNTLFTPGYPPAREGRRRRPCIRRIRFRVRGIRCCATGQQGL